MGVNRRLNDSKVGNIQHSTPNISQLGGPTQFIECWKLNVGWIFLSLSCLLGLLSCATAPPESLTRFEFTQPQMGLPFRIVLYAPNQSSAESAAAAAFARIKQLNDILSDYDSESELSQLSRTAGQDRAVKVGADLWFVLQRSQVLTEQSHGAFDVTVGPVVNLWRKARREKKLPDPARLTEARAAVGYQHLQLDAQHHTAKLVVPGMRLDLGGIAKGFALDEAIKILRARGNGRALVTGGGDMAAGDPPPGKTGWRIEIAPLDVANAPPKKFVSLKRAALATSGDLFQRLEIDGKRYSHIIDPHTGIGLTDHSLVTVIARDGITADGLATAVSVLGPINGIKLIEATPGAAVHLVRRPDLKIETYESSAFKKFCERR
jgi:thiamine biosynthesis lipoprotein